jgi:cytochrome c5
MTKFHHRTLLVIAMAAVCLVGCSAGSDEGTPTEDQVAGKDYPEGSWRTRYLELGRETYEMACASCHDEGKDGAPAKGDRDSWSDRSRLWSAVLTEHAKAGYQAMPCKGGQLELSDNAVEAAAEYMLNETFPELPRD